MFEIPLLDEALRTASIVTLWSAARQPAAGAPGAPQQPALAAQPQAVAQLAAQPAAAAEPALVAQQQLAGQQIQAGQGQPARPPPAYVPPSAGFMPGAWPLPPPHELLQLCRVTADASLSSTSFVLQQEPRGGSAYIWRR